MRGMGVRAVSPLYAAAAGMAKRSTHALTRVRTDTGRGTELGGGTVTRDRPLRHTMCGVRMVCVKWNCVVDRIDPQRRWAAGRHAPRICVWRFAAKLRIGEG